MVSKPTYIFIALVAVAIGAAAFLTDIGDIREHKFTVTLEYGYGGYGEGEGEYREGHTSLSRPSRMKGTISSVGRMRPAVSSQSTVHTRSSSGRIRN